MSIYRGRSRKDFSLASALYDAISDNDLSGVKYILEEKHADPNIVLPTSGISPFHLVIGNDSADFTLKVTTLILQHNGNPNVQSDDGLTPLHIAASWGRLEILKLLISCGGDPEIKDINWCTCYNYAVEYKHYEIATYLRNYILNYLHHSHEEEKSNYVLVLDKIIVTNNTSEGEYEPTMNKECTSVRNSLHHLPEAIPIDYVRNWCDKHAVEDSLLTEDQSQIIFNSKQSADTHNSYSCSDGFNSRVHNKNVIENFSLEYTPSIKYLSRKKKNRMKDTNKTSAFDTSSNSGKESGIVTLPNTLSYTDSLMPENLNSIYLDINDIKFKNLRDTSSDYFTGNEISGSSNIMDHNIFDVPSSPDCDTIKPEISPKKVNTVKASLQETIYMTGSEGHSTEGSFLSIAEVYKYVDNKEGIVLYEKRLLKNNSISDDNNGSVSQSSKLSSLPASFDYDTDSLRQELTQCGFQPGPITRTTKRIYLRRLRHLQKGHKLLQSEAAIAGKVFSSELERTLKNPSWNSDLTVYKAYEEIICEDFKNPDPSRKWREGTNKSSFTYLLLDPRITKNLPLRAEHMSLSETWKSFVSSIFYVGKGKRSRPYSHLYDAVLHWKDNKTSSNNKLQHILNIWKEDCGVVCLHVFQNVIPAEAYTREAAMITALNVNNIKNLKVGDFYGTASTWTMHQQKMLGVYLLYKAMLIFLNEGERQLKPADIN